MSRPPVAPALNRILLGGFAAIALLTAVWGTFAGWQHGGATASHRVPPPWAAIALPPHRVAGGPAILVGPRPPMHTARRVTRVPLITRQPHSASAPVGRTVTFIATAAAAPPPVAQWQRSTDGGRTWRNIPGAHRVSYSLRVTARANGERFRVLFRNAHGRVTSHAVTLRVGRAPRATAPRILVSPRSETVANGATATFSAAASGSPTPAAQWELSTDGGRSWRPIPGATATSYAVASPWFDNGFEYRALFTNAAGSATTAPATLSVTGAPPAATAPVVLTQPADASVPAGTTATFTAAATGNPAPATQWELSTDGGLAWTVIPSATASTYSVVAAAGESGDEYRALFTNSAGVAATRAATLTVTSAAPGATSPAITAQPADASVPSGGTATFTAAASGTPAPSVQWQLSTDAGETWAAIAGATTTSYSVLAAAGENGDEYRAVFSNTAGAATTRAATLTVTGTSGAPAITTQPVNQTVPADSTATFTAAASGSPAPTVQWQQSQDGGSSWSAIAGASATTLSVTATTQQFAEYRAVFTNSAGTVVSDAAVLTIAAQSSNWSGYAITGTGFTAASGSWTVPAVTCSSTTTYSSQWVGIDGYNDGTVEQDGTETDCISGSPYYGAWYEMYGDNAVNSGYEVPLSASSYPVYPGDAMTASITVSGTNWTLAISDATQNWSFSIPITWSGPAQSSAEWIAERPGVNGGLASLSDFGAMSFSGSSATDAGTSGPVSAFSFEPLEMTNGSDLLAAPGPLDATGENFGDTWYASS